MISVPSRAPPRDLQSRAGSALPKRGAEGGLVIGRLPRKGNHGTSALLFLVSWPGFLDAPETYYAHPPCIFAARMGDFLCLMRLSLSKLTLALPHRLLAMAINRFPPHFTTADHHDRCLEQLRSKCAPLEKYIYLNGLKGRDANLFYDLLLGNMKVHFTSFQRVNMSHMLSRKWSLSCTRRL